MCDELWAALSEIKERRGKNLTKDKMEMKVKMKSN